MIAGLIIILMITLVLPFVIKEVEHNLEIFLFIMGLLSVIVSKQLSLEMAGHILSNSFLYMITGAVLVVGVAFKLLKEHIARLVEKLLGSMPKPLFVFLMTIVLGLSSSVITAIIAALLLVEIIALIPLPRLTKIKVCIVDCFAIGLGAALTPIGEPISTIVISKLGKDFFYIIHLIGAYALQVIFVLALIAAAIVIIDEIRLSKKGNPDETEEDTILDETYSAIFIRTIKIFIFVIALELLGSGFKPVIDTYVLGLNSSLLYFGNMISAVLDNATLAAAEISPKMSTEQIRAILLGLLISGGMLIPGNIPNIIAAGKLKISSKEWTRFGVPLGLVLLGAYYVVLFLV